VTGARRRPGSALQRPSLQASLQLSLQFADASAREHLPRHRVRRWLQAALTVPAQITVRIVGLDEGLALNRSYRGQDHATNVLTFDYEREPVVVADLVLCAPVVAAEAQAQGLTLEDHYAHLLVHGALHALGMDHLQDDEAQQMEALESQLMLRLGYADPYAGPDVSLDPGLETGLRLKKPGPTP
jgi:probable rRNA maturation factor